MISNRVVHTTRINRELPSDIKGVRKQIENKRQRQLARRWINDDVSLLRGIPMVR